MRDQNAIQQVLGPVDCTVAVAQLEEPPPSRCSFPTHPGTVRVTVPVEPAYAVGLGNVRICSLPDFGAELTAAGRAHARNGRPQDLLTQLYARSMSPDLAEGVDRPYLSHLFACRSPTPFTKALAEGEERARNVLASAIDHLRSTAVEPWRSGIRSAVTARTVDLSHRYVAGGASAMLRQRGDGIRFRNGILELPTSFDADLELGRRSLRIQAVALGPRVTLAEPAHDHLTVRIPAGPAPRIEPGREAALRSLLGAGRAAALACIVTSGGVALLARDAFRARDGGWIVHLV